MIIVCKRVMVIHLFIYSFIYLFIKVIIKIQNPSLTLNEPMHTLELRVLRIA